MYKNSAISYFSVKLLDQVQYHTGSEITFQLVKREKGSTLTVPISEVTKRTPNTLLSVSENNYTTVYSKLLLADYENVINNSRILHFSKAMKFFFSEYGET